MDLFVTNGIADAIADAKHRAALIKDNAAIVKSDCALLGYNTILEREDLALIERDFEILLADTHALGKAVAQLRKLL